MCLNEAISVADLKSPNLVHGARRVELEAKLNKIETPTDVAIHPGAAQTYGRLAERLHGVLEGSEGGEGAR